MENLQGVFRKVNFWCRETLKFKKKKVKGRKLEIREAVGTSMERRDEKQFLD